ncbi:MAG: YfhO family protein [Lachnospiraceae bacterium]|nr:YfhO family protein [Lachnospiraceae bacterium]
MDKTMTREKKWDITRMAWIFAFFAPFVLMMAIFIGNGIFPFGKRSFMFSDMYHQYVPFFQEFMDKIKAGEGIDYSWNVGMGSNFRALFIYYTASPFNWLAFLFPQKYLIEFMSYAVVVKIGLAGLCAYLYLKSRDGRQQFSSMAALFCSTFYAMSGFVAAYNWNVMWMDCVVLFPLILMGLERLVHQGKMGLYVLALGLSIFSNFYISIMICMFLVIYFIYLFVMEKHSFSMVWKFAAGSLLAGGLAAVFLVPEVFALMETDFGDMDFPTEWKSYFTVLDVLARHCMAITTERALEHWPNIYCGSFVFLMIPLYAMNEKISAKRRFGFLAMAGIFLLSFATNMLDFIWHGMNYPDSLPARQSFLYVLLILVACYDCLTHLDGIKAEAVIKVYLGTVLFFLFVEKFVEVDDFETWTWLLNLAFVTVYAICLYLGMKKESRTIRYVVMAVAFVAVLSETAINMAYTSVGTTDRAAYVKHLEDYRALYERHAKGQNGFTRFEKFTRKTKNDATLAGFPSASVFSSTMNSYVMDFYTKFGMHHSKVYYGYDGATAFSSALLNVGYLYGDSEEWENELFRLVDEENGIYLYEAVQTLPFGYVAPVGFDLPEEMKDKGITIQNEIVNQLGIEGIMLKRVKSEQDGDDVVFTPKTDGIYYGCVTNYGTSKIKMTGGSPDEQNFKDLKKECILYLGSLKEGQTITLTNGDSKDDSPKISVNIYQLNLDLMTQALDILRQQHMTDVVVDNTKVSGKLSLAEAGRLILTIPVEKGWKAMVNGKETELSTFGDAFLALDLEPGEYEIALNYVPTGKHLGILGSLVSLVIAGVFFGIPWLWKKRKNAKPTSEEDAEEALEGESFVEVIEEENMAKATDVEYLDEAAADENVGEATGGEGLDEANEGKRLVEADEGERLVEAADKESYEESKKIPVERK